MHLPRHKTIQKFFLILLTFTALIVYWLVDISLFDRIMISILAVSGIACMLADVSITLVQVSLTFLFSYSLYQMLVYFNLPDWLIMLLFFALFSLLLSYVTEMFGLPKKTRAIYILLFSIIILEVFTTLSYFLINPLSQSLIMALIGYLFAGFCETVMKEEKGFGLYAFLTTVLISVIFAFSSWGTLS